MKFKTKMYWQLSPGEVFKTLEFYPFMRLHEGSIGLDGIRRGVVSYFCANDEVYELFLQTIDVRGLAVVNDFGEVVGEGDID